MRNNPLIGTLAAMALAMPSAPLLQQTPESGSRKYASNSAKTYKPSGLREQERQLKKMGKDMSALTLPKKYAIPVGKPANALAKRLGVKLNGIERPLDVVEYDVAAGYIVTNKGERLTGVVEPYWRTM